MFYSGESRMKSLEVHLKDGSVVEKRGEISKMQVVPALGALEFQERKIKETFSP